MSENEVQHVDRFLKSQLKRLVGYLDVHSYSQLWLIPWGYAKENVKDYNELVSVDTEPSYIHFTIGAVYSMEVFLLPVYRRKRAIWGGKGSCCLLSTPCLEFVEASYIRLSRSSKCLIQVLHIKLNIIETSFINNASYSSFCHRKLTKATMVGLSKFSPSPKTGN